MLKHVIVFVEVEDGDLLHCAKMKENMNYLTEIRLIFNFFIFPRRWKG